MSSPFGDVSGDRYGRIVRQLAEESARSFVNNWPKDYLTSLRRAQAIIRQLPEARDTRDILLHFMRLCEYSKLPGTLSPNQMGLLSEAMVLYGRCYAERLPLDSTILEAIQKAANSFNEDFPAALPSSSTVRRIGKGLHVLSKSYQARFRAAAAIGNAFRGDFPWGFSEAELADAKERADEVAARIAEHRHYGVKDCLMQDGIMHAPGEAWVFKDGMSLQEPDVPRARLIAVTHLVDRKKVRKSLDFVTVQRDGLRWQEVDFPTKLLVAIHENGNLTIDPEYGAQTLKAVFEGLDKAPAYEIFRLVHLLRLSDLVLPLEVYRQLDVPSWPVMPSTRKARAEQREQIPGLLRRLMVPRMRILEQPALIEAALQAEMIQAEADTDAAEAAQLGGKPRAKHKVPGFKRLLPKGCVASPEAHVLAWRQRKIILEDGWTFVRSHNRGKGENTSIGHEAIRRQKPADAE